MQGTHFKKLIVIIMTLCLTVSCASFMTLYSFAEEETTQQDEPRLIDGTDPSLKSTVNVSRSSSKGASTGSSLDPAKIKQISWIHDSWSSLISWNTLHPTDRTHIRKITSVKDDENHELLNDPDVYAGYGYCCEPGTNTPEDLHFGHIFSSDDGEYTVRDGGNEHGRAQKIRAFNEESAQAAGEKYAAMRKLLYYLPGGPGWKTTTKAWYTDFKNTHGLGKKGVKGGITGYHELAHLALSYKWQKVGGAEHPSGYDAETLVGWCDDATQKLIKRYGGRVADETDVAELPDPPEDFVVFYVLTEDAQDIWGVLGDFDTDESWALLKKETSGTPVFHNHPENYSLKGAVYYVYKDSACTKRAKTADGESFELVTKADGTTNKVMLDTGNYWAKETTPSPGHKLDTTPRKAEVSEENNEDDPAVFKSKEPPVYGYLKVKKSFAKTPYNHPEKYSLSGAVYHVYTDSECKTRAKDTEGEAIVLTTDEQGETNIVKLDIGNYWIREITASQGCILDTKVHKAAVTEENAASGKAKTVSSNEPLEGAHVTLEKELNYTPYNHPENYSLAGAKYSVYMDAACTKPAKNTSGNVVSFITDENGKATTVEQVEPGDYWAKETTPSEGCLTDPTPRKLNVTSSATDADPAVFHSTEPAVSGFLYVKKVPDCDFYSHPENYKLEGAVYYVYTDSSCAENTRAKDINGNLVTLTTNAQGITKKVNVDIGDYWVKEKTPSQGFGTDGAAQKKTVTKDNTADSAVEFKSTEPSESGYLYVRKKADQEFYNHPENYKLEGAVYYVYTDSSCAENKRARDRSGNLISLTTNEKGLTKKVNVDIGDYWIKEKTPSQGFDTNGKVQKKTVTKDNNADAAVGFESREPSQSGWVTLRKDAAKTETDFIKEAPGNYTIAGAVYYLYIDEACKTRARDRSGKLITMTTGADGNTDKVQVDIGQYWACEIEASKGFMLDTAVNHGIPVTITKENTKASPALFSSTDPPAYGSLVKLRKTNNSGDFGWRRLIGAEYTLRYYDADPSVTDVSGMTPKRSWVFRTAEKKDANDTSYAGIDFTSDEKVSGDEFYTENGKRIMPCGVFTIQETKAPKGMSRNKSVYYGKVYQPSNGSAAKTESNTTDISDMTIETGTENDVVNDEKLQSVVLEIKKTDAETGEAKAQGQESKSRKAVFGSLAGAEYAVYYDDPDEPEPVRAGTIVTDENGSGCIDKYGEDSWNDSGQPLRPGTYLIEEVAAPPGYTLDSLYNKEENGIYEKGKHIIRARVQEGNTASFTYTVNSNDHAHETHIHKKDLTTGEELPGAVLQVLDSEGNIVEEWVSGNEPHDIIALHDETQGLKDGRYILREITAPYGYDISEDVTFSVRSGEIENSVTMMNKPVCVGTAASDGTTMSKAGLRSENDTITDLVKIEGLVAGREYKISGILMNITTGEPLTDSEKKTITAEKEFTADAENMEVEIFFHVDSSDFTQDTTLVAFEKLYRTSKLREYEEMPVLLGGHEDIDDEAQAVHYGGIASTKAVNKKSGSSNILAGSNAVIKDTVEYRNLAAGENYEISGELYDKTSGRLTGIKAVMDFTPEKPDGTVDVEFRFDSSAFEGHSLVAFETLSVKTDTDGKDEYVTVDKHEDPEDGDQTIHVPEIRTTAVASDTEEHITMAGNETLIKDIVRYRNITPGKEYIVKGKLVYKENGNDVLDGGNSVTAESRFTSDKPDGEVMLEFRFDCTALAGKTIVAFEECYEEDTLIGVHANLTDEEQSIHIPKIGTEAVDNNTHDHILGMYEKNTITDTVTYENLIPDKEYIMKGVLMRKSSGEKVGTDGKDITAEIAFTPEASSGSVELTFEIDRVDLVDLEGDAVVAFEECLLEGVTIAAHTELDDESQTVHIPEIRTTALDRKTKEHVAASGGMITVSDEVRYKHLVPGKKYRVSGALINKSTGKPVKINGMPVTSDKVFTPDTSDGSVVLKFTFEADVLRGEAIVAYETVYYNDTIIAIHADTNDEEQTVYIPEIRTVVNDPDNGRAVDMVCYRGLIPGRTYIMRGYFVDKKNGRKVEGSGGEKKFRAEKSNGTIEVRLSLGDAKSTVVAFEECYLIRESGDNNTGPEEVLVAEHKDPDDEDQTLIIKNVPPPEPPVDTGDGTNIAAWTILMLVSASVLILGCLYIRRKRRVEKDILIK